MINGIETDVIQRTKVTCTRCGFCKTFETVLEEDYDYQYQEMDLSEIDYTKDFFKVPMLNNNLLCRSCNEEFMKFAKGFEETLKATSLKNRRIRGFYGKKKR